MPNDGVVKIEVPGYGTRRERCDQVDQGINVYGNGSSASRFAVYPYNFIVSSGSFEFTLVFTSAAESSEFSRWTENYLRRAASGAVGFLRPWTVTVLGRNFQKSGVPQGVTYGETHGKVIYKQQIKMKGTSSPVEKPRDVSRRIRQGSSFTTREDYYFIPDRPALTNESDERESIFLAEDLLYPNRGPGGGLNGVLR